MALVKCKDCGADVSSHAEKCEKCGRPLETVGQMLGWLLLGLIGAPILFLLIISSIY
tara:strand:+ start:182 stop:352 length:171 start_codon:yes stop_codon:yes gene_type:complete